MLADGNGCGPRKFSFFCACSAGCSHDDSPFEALPHSAGSEIRVSEEPQKGGAALKGGQSISVLEALLRILDGAAAIAKTVIGLGKVREDPGVFGRDVQGRVRCGDGLFAKFVFRVVGAEHGQNGRFLGIQRRVLLEKVERPGACRAEASDALAEKWLYPIIFTQGVAGLRRGETENCIHCRGSMINRSE